MRICKLFDKYRDNDLGVFERKEFETHLTGCEDCRARLTLLNNIVHLLKSEDVRPVDMADRIARETFRRSHSWDFEVISWLRPGPAVAAAALMLALFSSLLMISSSRQGGTYGDYEKLMDDADAVNLGTRVSETRTDSELVVWLEQEGYSQ